MLFDAHTRSFAALGGVARRGIYDNMRTAVDKVHKGKGRTVNARFAVIQRALSELVRERTMVVIAHRLRSVRHADRIFVLDKGRLVEQGSHDELLLHPGVYARLWQQQELTLDWRLAEN